MGEGDRAEWLYRDNWRGRWKLGVVPGAYFGCFMSLLTLESEGASQSTIGLLVWWGLGSLPPGIAIGAWTAWQRGEQWPQAKGLTFAERWEVLRGLRRGTSPQDVHLARALLDRVSAGDQLRQDDGFIAFMARFDRTTFGAVVFPLVGLAGAVALAVVEFGNNHPIAGTTMAVVAAGLAVAGVAELVRRLRGNGTEVRRAAAVEAARDVLARHRGDSVGDDATTGPAGSIA